MTFFLVLITIAFGISLFLILTKTDYPKGEKVVSRISFYFLIGTIICIILMLFDLRLKGAYTTTIIGLTFILSIILLFRLTQKKWAKMLSGLFVIPLCALGILSFFSGIAILPIYVLILPFEPPMAKFEMDAKHNIEVRVGGFLACGENLVITKSTLGIFDKQKLIGNSSCVIGIDKIETIEFNEDIAKFLIYHDGKQTGVENPYQYQVELEDLQ